MISRKFAILILLVAGSAACDNKFGADEVKMPPARLPDQLCKQASDGIKKLNESGGFHYAGAGEGTLEEQAWLQMSEPQREQLLNLLAVDAACTSEQPVAEATARVRNEGGRTLSERVIQTSADLSSIGGE